MCRIKKRKNMLSRFPPKTCDVVSSTNAQSNPKESTNAQANEQKIASGCNDQTKKTDGDHIIAINKAIELKQQEQQTGEAHAVKAIENLPEASPPEVKVSSGERKRKTSKRTAAFSAETAKEDELRTCSTQTMLSEVAGCDEKSNNVSGGARYPSKLGFPRYFEGLLGSMLSIKKQIVLEDTQVTTEMKPTDSRVTYELSTDDTLAGVPKVMPHFED
uniref:Uncharacterized protein n=1 Tax=Ascaris lumbricoides TaxID=6252 RepID=A0A0M3I338_ASCLU